MKYKLNFLEFPFWIILLLSMFYDIWIFNGALDFHICKIFKLSNCRDKLGEGNGNPLQYSCLENPMDRGTWWGAVHRVAQNRTWLKQLSMHACIGEGNGNPLQYSCLEDPRDRGAWWAAIYGVTQSWTEAWLKRLSSSSKDKLIFFSIYSKYLARSFYPEFVSSYFSSSSVLLKEKNGNWIDRWN